MVQTVYIGSLSRLTWKAYPHFFIDVIDNYQEFDISYPGKYNLFFFRKEPVIVDKNGELLFWRSRQKSGSTPCYQTEDFSIALLRREELFDPRKYEVVIEKGVRLLFISDFGAKEFALPQTLLEMVTIELDVYLFYSLCTPENILYKGFYYNREKQSLRLISGNDTQLQVDCSGIAVSRQNSVSTF
jgi:hypothetical protein